MKINYYKYVRYKYVISELRGFKDLRIKHRESRDCNRCDKGNKFYILLQYFIIKSSNIKFYIIIKVSSCICLYNIISLLNKMSNLLHKIFLNISSDNKFNTFRIKDCTLYWTLLYSIIINILCYVLYFIIHIT